MDRLLSACRQWLLACVVGGATLTGAASPAAAQANPNIGRSVFAASCAMCHMAASNGHSLIGPNLYGVVGRRAGTAPNFNYSPALQHAGIVWTPQQLQAYLQAPSRVVPGNRMPFAGLREPQAAAVVAYLGTLGGNPPTR